MQFDLSFKMMNKFSIMKIRLTLKLVFENPIKKFSQFDDFVI